MRAPITIIIPTLNAAQSLPGCAASVFEGLSTGLIRELIVSDGGSSDATAEIAEELGATFLVGEASRGGQIGRAVEAAQSDWLLILHADTQLPAGWSEVVADHLSQSTPAYFKLGFDKGGAGAKLTAAWANLRSRLFNLPYGDQGLLIRRDMLAQVGGYRDIPLMEDVDLARRLPRMTGLPITARTSAARYVREGWLRRGTRNLVLLLRFLTGADPHVLAQAYRRSSRRS